MMNSLDANSKPLALPAPPPPSANPLVRGSVFITSPVSAGDSANPSTDLNSPTLGGLLRALRRQFLLAFILALAGAGLVVAALFYVVPPRYTAQAAVHIRAQREAAIVVPGGEPTEPEFVVVKANMAAMIKSPVVLSAAVNRVKDQNLSIIQDQENPVKYLETAVKTDYLLGPEVLRITLSGDDPREVSVMVNAIADAFVEENSRRESDRRRQRLEQLEANRQSTENALRIKKQTLRKLEESRGLDDHKTLEIIYEASQRNLSTVKKEAVDTELALVQAQVEIKTIEAKLAELPTAKIGTFQIAKELEKLPQGQLFKERMALLIAERQYIATNVAKEAAGPFLENNDRAKLALLKDQADLAELMRPELERKVREEMVSKSEDDLAKAKEKVSGLTRKKTVIDQHVRAAEESVKNSNPSAKRWPADVEALRDEVARLDSAITKLGEIIALQKVEPPNASRTTSWQRAEVPQGRDMKKQLRLGGVAGIGTFVLLLFGVAFLEFRSGRVGAVDDLTRGGINVIGTLPAVPAGRGAAGPGEQRWQGELNEAIDSIRTLLLHAARSEDLHVIMVTSAVGGEGKTSLASQLAASLARVWRRTLLVDGDLRKPALHTLFDVPQEPGFSEVLRGELKAGEAIKPTSLSRLWVMPAGQSDGHALQALSQDNVRGLFHELKQQYDFIIVDASPVLPVADTLSLGQHVDGVLFAVLRDFSRGPALQVAQQRLQNLGIRTLGAVVLGSSDKHAALEYQYAEKS